MPICNYVLFYFNSLKNCQCMLFKSVVVNSDFGGIIWFFFSFEGGSTMAQILILAWAITTGWMEAVWQSAALAQIKILAHTSAWPPILWEQFWVRRQSSNLHVSLWEKSIIFVFLKIYSYYNHSRKKRTLPITCSLRANMNL